MVKVLYFAMLRDAIGKAEETMELPEDVKTVEQFMDFLVAKGEPYASALANRKRVRAAINQTMALTDTSVVGATEIALFPPVTGG